MNKEIIEMLIIHQKRFPLMQPQDVVKLLYQNEFGGGHLISDANRSLMYLTKEYDSIQLFEEENYLPIGNGLIRLNLRGFKGSPVELNQLFVESANQVKGNLDEFLKKLNAVKQWILDDNIFSFSCEAFLEYLEKYVASGCPMVSHSEIFRNLYQPAYRVILKELYEKYDG